MAEGYGVKANDWAVFAVIAAVLGAAYLMFSKTVNAAQDTVGQVAGGIGEVYGDIKGGLSSVGKSLTAPFQQVDKSNNAYIPPMPLVTTIYGTSTAGSEPFLKYLVEHGAYDTNAQQPLMTSNLQNVTPIATTGMTEASVIAASYNPTPDAPGDMGHGQGVFQQAVSNPYGSSSKSVTSSSSKSVTSKTTKPSTFQQAVSNPYGSSSKSVTSSKSTSSLPTSNLNNPTPTATRNMKL